MKEQIIAAIKQYLGKVTTYTNSLDRIRFERACVNGARNFLQQESEQLYAAIAPHIEQPDLWKDAPKWAKYRTVDKNGDVTFWEKEPACLSECWVDGGNYKSIAYEFQNWENSLQTRP